MGSDGVMHMRAGHGPTGATKSPFLLARLNVNMVRPEEVEAWCCWQARHHLSSLRHFKRAPSCVEVGKNWWKVHLPILSPDAWKLAHGFLLKAKIWLSNVLSFLYSNTERLQVHKLKDEQTLSVLHSVTVSPIIWEFRPHNLSYLSLETFLVIWKYKCVFYFIRWYDISHIWLNEPFCHPQFLELVSVCIEKKASIHFLSSKIRKTGKQTQGHVPRSNRCERGKMYNEGVSQPLGSWSH